jgi:phospholipid/cholesterol/gamma-HCH transport system substrate-binding protein
MKRVLAATAAFALLSATIVYLTVDGPQTKKAAGAQFASVVQLYPGDEVRVLGVPVGTVTTVTPGAASTRVDFVYDADAPVPADASAVVVAPSLVAGRYIQLTPAKVDGPRLADGAVIPMSRTAVPVEFDELKKQLNELTKVLGPDGINSGGSLNRAISTASANLAGNGKTLNDAISNLSSAVGTLSDGREDLFSTVRNLSTVVSALRRANSEVAPFTQHLASVSDVLASSGDDTRKMLDTLDTSVQQIGNFVQEHHEELGTSVDGVSKVVQTVSQNRQALADLVQKLPNVISDFSNIYDPLTGSMTGALAATQFQDFPSSVCWAFFGQNDAYNRCKATMAPALASFNMSYPPLAVNPLVRPGSANCIRATDGAPPDPHPELHERLDPRENKPNLGFAERPLGSRCGEAPGPGDKLQALFAPGLGTR